MEIIKFSDEFLQRLTSKALDSPRGRQHWNVHQSFEEPCQKLFNAIAVDSYIRPHRHTGHGKDECMIGIRGMLTLVVFDDTGRVVELVPFGAGQMQSRDRKAMSAGLQIPPGVWHTVVANRPNSILFEVKSGPFDALAPKEFASWAPQEHSEAARPYLAQLQQLCEAAELSAA